jgi:hypothetical protein
MLRYPNKYRLDENGDMIGDAPAWTNTKKDGKQINDDPDDTCFDWTTGPVPNTTNFAPTGVPNLKNIRWTNTITPFGNTTSNCPTKLHIYCFEQ